jgi:hypothetical protein
MFGRVDHIAPLYYGRRCTIRHQNAQRYF